LPVVIPDQVHHRVKRDVGLDRRHRHFEVVTGGHGGGAAPVAELDGSAEALQVRVTHG